MLSPSCVRSDALSVMLLSHAGSMEAVDGWKDKVGNQVFSESYRRASAMVTCFAYWSRLDVRKSLHRDCACEGVISANSNMQTMLIRNHKNVDRCCFVLYLRRMWVVIKSSSARGSP